VSLRYLCLALKPLLANRKLSPYAVVKKEPGHKVAQRYHYDAGTVAAAVGEKAHLGMKQR